MTAIRRATIESITLAVALTGLSAVSGVALATARYTVTLSVPRYVDAGQPLKVKATGVSDAGSHLEVFVSTRSCARTVAAETKRASHPLITKNVLDRYTSAKAVRSRVGTYHVCAYLTPIGHGSVTRARASATYYALAGAY